MIPHTETLTIPCPYMGRDPRYPRTHAQLYHSHQSDPVLLLWLPGGPGQSTDCSELEGLWGQRRILVPRNPYPIHSYRQTGPLTWDYVPQAFDTDQPLRIRSLIQWARSQRYRVFLGGHSNGVPRAVGYLAHSPRHQSLVDGVILSAGHVGGAYGPRLPLDRVEWSVPVLVLHHARDHCAKCSPAYQHWVYQTIARANRSHTHMVCLTTGDPMIDTDCSGSALHHMYRESLAEAAHAVDQFILHTVS